MPLSMLAEAFMDPVGVQSAPPLRHVARCRLRASWAGKAPCLARAGVRESLHARETERLSGAKNESRKIIRKTRSR